jgi:HSP20 family protein
MTELVPRGARVLEPVEDVDLFDRMFERMFEDWRNWLPLRLPLLLGERLIPEDRIRVDEFDEDGALVVRAEIPGVDPDKDVEITVSDHMLHIRAERRSKEEKEEKSYRRHELRYGSFTRTIPLPEGTSESAVKASYKDGILEVRVPEPKPEPMKKVPIARR